MVSSMSTGLINPADLSFTKACQGNSCVVVLCSGQRKRLTSKAISASIGALHGSKLREHLRRRAAGMIQTALDLMDAWVLQCTEPGLKGVSSNKQPTPVPRWIDALLLLVNSCTATIWEASLQKEDATNQAPEPQARCLSQNTDQPVLMVCSQRSPVIW